VIALPWPVVALILWAAVMLLDLADLLVRARRCKR
jgi:hypothetical protein